MPKTPLSIEKVPALLILVLLLVAACSSPLPGVNPPPDSLTPGEPETIYLPAVQGPIDSPAVQELPPLPKGIPQNEWFTPAGWEIPVMPDALAGEEMNGHYVYTVPMRMFAVQVYYEEQLSTGGWESLSIAESPNLTVMLFQQGNTRLNITIQYQSELEISYVQITEL